MEKDLTWKLEAYQQADTIREVWIAWTNTVRVDRYVREDGGWRILALEDREATLRSEAFSLEIPVAELYELVL